MGRASNRKKQRRAQQLLDASALRIVVCWSPAAHLEPALDLLKAAVLYGDQVRLLSPTLSLITNAEALAGADSQTFARALLDIVLSAPELNPPLAAAIHELTGDLEPEQSAELLHRLLLDPSFASHLPEPFAAEVRRLPGLMSQLRERLVEAVDEHVGSSGLSEVQPALDSGTLRLQLFDLDPMDDSFDAHLFSALQGLLDDESAYPLFDDPFRKLVGSAIDAGALTAPVRPVRRATEAAAAHDFLARLPTFPLATMDEVLDVRSELAVPLVRFRSEMVGLSRDLGTSVLDPDFDEAATTAWRERVMPQLQHLEELVEEKKLRRIFGQELLTRADALAPGLTFAAGVITQDSRLLAVASAVAGGTAAVSAVGRGVVRRSDLGKTVAASPYFFLHDTERLLDRRRGKR